MRVNSVTWVDCKVVTKKCHDLIEQMMEYNKYTVPDETRGKGSLGGDSMVMCAAIDLRNILNKLIEKSPN